MPLTDTIRAYLGWCPAAGSMRVNRPVHPEAGTVDASAGRDEAPEIVHHWRSRYRNQLLVMAVTMSVAAATLFLLIEEVPGYYTVGIAIGIGSGIGFLLSYQKRYARVAAGEFARARGTRAQRVIRYLTSLTLFSVPASFVVIVAGVACFALLGLVGAIFAFSLGMSITWWALYCLTVFWERRHQTTLISDHGLMYTMDMVVHGDNRSEGGVW